MKKTISILLTLCMIVAMLPTAMAAKKATFKDVPEDMWCFDYVEYVAEEGYFKGTTATTFEPNGPMTRQQFVVVLSRMVNAKVNNNQSPFSDVPAGSYSAGAIAWAVKHNIVQGYEDGSFHPAEPITRQQMAALMNRFMTYYANNYGARYISKNGKITFKDAADIGAYAKSAVDYCVKYGLILGYEDGTFRPSANATRAHVAAIIQRLDKITRKSSGGGGGTIIGEYYTITFEGATVGGKRSVSVPENTLYECKQPDAKAGYTFKNWSYAGNTYNVGQKILVTGHITLTANWDEIINPNDLLKSAFETTIGYTNEVLFGAEGYYTKLQAAVNNIDSVVVNKIEPENFNNDGKVAGDTREITVSASATLNDATIESLVKTAVNTAINVVQPGTYGDDEVWTADEVETVVNKVVDALGLEWNGEISKAVAEDIEAQIKVIAEIEANAAIKTARNAFKDSGEYIFDTVTLKVADADVATLDTSKNLTKEDAVDYAIALAKAVANDLYASLKSHTTETKTVTLETSVDMAFAGMPDKAKSFPSTYTLNVALTLSNEQVSYWYEAGADTHHLSVTVTDGMQATYDQALSAAAQKVIDVVMGDIYDELDAAIAEYVGVIENDASVASLLSMLESFGIHADLDAAVADAVTAWKAANLGDSVGETADAYGLYNFLWNLDGEIRLEGNTYALYRNGVKVNKALLNNQCILDSITDWANDIMEEVEQIGAISIVEGSVTNMIPDDKDDPADPSDDGIDPGSKEAYQQMILTKFDDLLSEEHTVNVPFIGNMTLTAYDLIVGNRFTRMFGYDVYGMAGETIPAGATVMKNDTVANQIAAIDQALTGDYTGDTLLTELQEGLVNYVNSMVNTEYSNMVNKLQVTSPEIYDLITDCSANCDLEEYLKKLTMERMGLPVYAAAQYPALNVMIADGNDTNDAASVEYVLDAWIDTNLDIETMMASRITLADINAKTDPKITAMVSGAGKYLDALYLMQDVNTFDEVAETEATTLAGILGSDKLQAVIAQAGVSDETMTKALNALALAIEKLPAKATVTVNGVDYNEAELARVKAAAEDHDLAKVCDELAALLAELGNLSLKNADPVTVEVSYGERRVTCALHIVIA